MGVLTFWLFAQTTLNIAPDMQKDLGLGTSLMNIAVAATALFSGIFIVFIGGLADRIGRVRIVMIGFVLSIIGSLLIGFAPGGALAAYLLLPGRALQGLSGACIMPASLALVKTFWDGEARQRAVSMWSIGSWGGSGFCSLFGGLVAQNFGWRWIFFATVVVSLLGMALMKGTPESKAEGQIQPHRDYDLAQIARVGAAPARHPRRRTEDAGGAARRGPLTRRETTMRVVVCTIVHHPADARIYHRQIRALLDAGHEVTYIAPVDSQDFHPERTRPSLQLTAVPRASGRRRTGAIRAARSALARHAADADLLLIHDPELLLALPSRRRRPPVIWDVHEDTAAALSTKPWLPRPLRPPAAVAVRTAERMAERYVHLILAERGYVARFARPHPVVPNTTYVPDVPAPPGDDRRVVYVGHLSPDRGTADMIELARLLRPHGITVELIGPADARARAQIEPAQAAGLLRWRGFVPNDQAMPMLDGALAGLSLLHDEPNFRHSLPTKVVEYMARGVPVVTTPLPAAAELARGHECGFVVPFGDPRAAADAVLGLDGDISLRAKMGRRGHEAAAKSLGWPSDAREFVAQLESWAKGKLPARHLPISRS